MTLSNNLIKVSPTHKHFAMRAYVVQQIAAWALVLSLLATYTPSWPLNSTTLWTWGGVFLGTWLVRMALFYPLYKLTPVELDKKPHLKILPLVNIAIATSFWVWTIELFIGPTLSIRELILFGGLLSMSISLSSMWSVTPVVPLLSFAVIWPAFSYFLWIRNHVSVVDILILNAGIATTLSISFFISTMQLRSYVERGAELEDALASSKEANSQLQILRDAAYKSLASRSAFFAEASHDFQQRLGAARLWVITALRTADGRPEILTPIERVGRELDKLQGDFDSIIDFARAEAMDSNVSLRSIPLQTIFQSLDVRFEMVADRDGRDLLIRPTNIVLGTDSVLLTRILENLISNALKHTKRRVLVAARFRGTNVAIEVWDQGPGIDRVAHERIFEPYYQEPLQGSDAKKRDGVGLGLAIVKRFAKSLGYTVKVKSVLGKGSVFRVLVPIAFTSTSHALPTYVQRITASDHSEV